MKVWELEKGKIYKCNDDVYQIEENKELLVHNKVRNYWMKTGRTYNDVINMDFTEIKRELDWNKVPSWTKVQVRDEDTREWQNVYYLGLSELRTFPYLITFYDKFTFNDEYASGLSYKQIRLHESVTPQADWYKEI